MARTKLLYVFDAYCGWCFGFSPSLDGLLRSHEGDLDVEVIPGGLFVGNRVRPMREMPFIARANAKIAEVTGVTFGARYLDLAREGSFVMDSGKAARGLLALQRLAPGRDAEIAASMQRSFYVEGASLGEPATYAAIGRSFGLDAHAVLAALDAVGPEDVAAAFARAASLGAQEFPTLFVQRDEQPVLLARGRATAQELVARISPFLT